MLQFHYKIIQLYILYFSIYLHILSKVKLQYTNKINSIKQLPKLVQIRNFITKEKPVLLLYSVQKEVGNYPQKVDPIDVKYQPSCNCLKFLLNVKSWCTGSNELKYIKNEMKRKEMR